MSESKDLPPRPWRAVEEPHETAVLDAEGCYLVSLIGDRRRDYAALLCAAPDLPAACEMAYAAANHMRGCPICRVAPGPCKTGAELFLRAADTNIKALSKARGSD